MKDKIVDRVSAIGHKISHIGKKIPVIYYIIVFVILVIFVANELYLWHKDTGNDTEMDRDLIAREIDDFMIKSVTNITSLDSNRELYGTIDPSFESSTYSIAKNISVKDLSAKITSQHVHTGKNSLHVTRSGEKSGSVQLRDYVTIQKDRYYKIGFWIASTDSGTIELAISQSDPGAVIAHVGVVGDQEMRYRYYEYNFHAPADAQHISFLVAGKNLQNFHVDDIKLIPLRIDNSQELSSVKVTMIGNGSDLQNGESQNAHDVQSHVLGHKNSLIGQVFTPGKTDLRGVSFFMIKNGDGGINNYTISVREYDEKTQKFLSGDIASHVFASKDVTSEIMFFPLNTKLDKEKKYWIGISNRGVNVNKDHHLGIGQASTNDAYPHGTGIVQTGDNASFVTDNDLFFTVYYAQPLMIGSQLMPYGDTLYDLGKGIVRSDRHFDSAGGSNVLDIHDKKGVIVDAWGNIQLQEKSSYVTYRFGYENTNVQHVTVNNLYFHNNMHLSLSTDGKKWTEIYADRSGKKWQNSGRIDVDILGDTEYIYIKMQNNGDEDSYFLGGQVVINLIDHAYGK